MADLDQSIYERYKNNSKFSFIGISDTDSLSTAVFLRAVSTNIPVVLDNGTGEIGYKLWTDVWFPFHGVNTATNPGVVLSPYPFDLIIDSTQTIVYLNREYDPAGMLEVLEKIDKGEDVLNRTSADKMVPFQNFLVNFPNPFSPKTSFRFNSVHLRDIEHGAPMLNIFSTDGRVLRTLPLLRRADRTFEVGWDGKNRAGVLIPSGVYFYQVKTGRKVFRKKLTIIR